MFTFSEICLLFCLLGERVIITVEEDEEGGLGYTTTLRITKVSDEDNGKYTLLIKNTAGETKVKISLSLKYPEYKSNNKCI